MVRDTKGRFAKGHEPPLKKLSDEQVIRWSQHVGLSISEIAERAGVDVTTMRKRFNKLKIPLHEFKRPQSKGNKRHGYYLAIKTYRNLNPTCELCDWKYGTDIHHIIPLRKGGTNCFTNLVSLCPNHHRMADKGLLLIKKTEQGTVFKDLTEEQKIWRCD